MELKTVQTELARLSLYYPQAKRTPKEIKMLADMWLEDVGHLPADRFRECVRIHRQRSAFFPAGADILAIHREIANRPAFKQLPALEELSREQIRQNQAKIVEIRDRIAKATNANKGGN